MNVLSLFDGMSCGQIALNRVGIKYNNYFASEIDEKAIYITQKNYPDTKQLGSIQDDPRDVFLKLMEANISVGKIFNDGQIDVESQVLNTIATFEYRFKNNY